MFKFGFSSENAGGGHTDLIVTSNSGAMQWTTASELRITHEHILFVDTNPPCGVFECGSHRIAHIRPEVAIKNIQDEGIAEAEMRHSDLIPSKYEGGLKIWECTQDLANFMLRELSHLLGPGVHILDLGCGTGILGIIALLHGCTVHFQDYNASVLNAVTIPNVLMNVSKDERESRLAGCRFFAGDWASFVDLTQHEDLKYDIILTSETIYNPMSYYKLHSVFKERLKPTGFVVLAAKTCYFGVGGGVRQFENFLIENDCFTSMRCWTSREGNCMFSKTGISPKREVQICVPGHRNRGDTKGDSEVVIC